MKRYLLLSFILVFFTVSFMSSPSICFSEPDSKVWEHFADNMYYNKTDVSKSSNLNFITVWTYNIVTDDYRKQMVEISKKHDPELSEKYKNFDHFVSIWGFDCEKRLFRIKDRVDYDNRWKIINRYTYQNEERVKIIPNSPVEKLYNKICITPGKPTKKK